MSKSLEEKAKQIGINMARDAMRKKIRRMRRAARSEKWVGDYESACLEMWEFLRYQEPRTRRKKGGM